MTQSKSNIQLIVAMMIVFIANLVPFASVTQGQGRLSQVRNNVRRHHTPRPSHSNHDNDHDDHDDDHRGHGHKPKKKRGRRGHHNHGGSGNFFLMSALFDDCNRQPQIVEHIHIYEPVPVAAPAYTTPHVVPQVLPQVAPLQAEEFIVQEPYVQPRFDSWFSSWSGRVSAFYGYDFDDMSHGSLAALFQAPGFLGLDTSINMFRENGTTFRDHLWVGDVNVVYEAISTDNFRARVGVGINWLGDYYGGEAGGNLTFGMDWQINPNWVLTGETDFGSLGDTDLFHAQLSIGRQFDRAEWMTGYNHYDIGGATIGGLFTGLRFRF